MEKVSRKLIAEIKGSIDARIKNKTIDVDSVLREKLIEIEFQKRYMPQYDPIETAIQMDELYALKSILTANQINELFKHKDVCPAYFIENLYDVVTSGKHVSLTEEFWQGTNPYFWDE